MTRYLHILRRLEKQRAIGDRHGAGTERRGEGPIRPATPRVISFPDLRPGEEHGLAFGSLLDTLWTHAVGSRGPIYVLAGVSKPNSTRIIAAGLVAQAKTTSLRFAAASLSVAEGRRVLETHPAEETVQAAAFATTGGARPSRLPLSLSGSYEGNEGFADWLRATSADHDLTIVDAPPLVDCPEAAILARACNGLILAVQPMITDRHALRTAVAQADRVGCRLLGLVIVGGREWLPRWLRRALPAPDYHGPRTSRAGQLKSLPGE